jgi:hypothetical protein
MAAMEGHRPCHGEERIPWRRQPQYLKEQAMGNTASWLSGYLFPEEQALWHAASRGDDRELRGAISTLTPETRRYLEWRDTCSGRTPLAQAAANGKLECAKLLVAAGVNVNAKDFKGNTPLHLACRFGHSELVTFLVHLVSVVPFEANLRLLTPLDVARDRLRKRDENGELPTSSRSIAYEQCITELEKVRPSVLYPFKQAQRIN